MAEMEDCERAAGALRDFYQRSHRLIDRIMTAEGASYARARILKEIGQEGAMRSIDLSAAFGHAPRTVTEAIDALERDGLVRRDPDPGDRRAKRISLTEAGVRALDVVEITRLKYLEDVFGVLSVPECDEIVRVIGKLNDRLVALGG